MAFIDEYKFPYLARQINGPIAETFGKSIDSVYEKDQPFLDFLSRFDIENLEGEWLDELGQVLGFSRPWITIPELVTAFEFDGLPPSLMGRTHGFSNDPQHAFNNDGGVLDDLYRDRNYYKMEDPRYQNFLRAIVKVKKTLSISSIADVMDTFMDDTRYAITYVSPGNDIIIYIPPSQEIYEEYLEIAFKSIFTTSPTIYILVNVNFDNDYTKPHIESVVHEITGSNNFTVSYSFDGEHAVFTVTLDSSLSSFKDEVEETLDDIYRNADDIEIVVVVGP